jgi:hypothetical protein
MRLSWDDLQLLEVIRLVHGKVGSQEDRARAQRRNQNEFRGKDCSELV